MDVRIGVRVAVRVDVTATTVERLVPVAVGGEVRVAVGAERWVEVAVADGRWVKVAKSFESIGPEETPEAVPVPGVKYVSSCSAAPAPTGGTVFPGRREKKFGVRLERILADRLQVEGSRAASCPAPIIKATPMEIMIANRLRSRLLFGDRGFTAHLLLLVFRGRQGNMECTARIGLFVIARAFNPDAAAVCLYDTTRNGQPQAWSAAFELCLPGRV